MAKSLLKWRVPPKPTGKFRSFQRRGWPHADFNEAPNRVAVQINCKDDYNAYRVKTAKHEELTVFIAAYDDAGNWKWRKANQTCTALGEAKALAERLYAKFPQFLPPELRPKIEPKVD